MRNYEICNRCNVGKILKLSTEHLYCDFDLLYPKNKPFLERSIHKECYFELEQTILTGDEKDE